MAWLLIIIVQTGSAQRVDDISRDMLEAHNAERARVKVRPLVWSAKLAAYAQQWANSLLTDRQLRHRRNSPYGENLYALAGGRASPRVVVRIWSSESAEEYNHYTQIVWSKTTEVGCAVARNSRREVWVCSYNPAGNVVGESPY